MKNARTPKTKKIEERRLCECRQCHHELPLLAPLDVARQLDAILAQPYAEHMVRIRVHQLAQQLYGLCAVCAPLPVDPSVGAPLPVDPPADRTRARVLAPCQCATHRALRAGQRDGT